MPYASAEVSIQNMRNFSKAILHCFSDSASLIVFWLLYILIELTLVSYSYQGLKCEMRNVRVTDISQRLVLFWLQSCLNSIRKYSNACWAASGHIGVSLCFSVILQSALQLLMAVEHLLLKHQLGGRDTHGPSWSFKAMGAKWAVYYEGEIFTKCTSQWKTFPSPLALQFCCKTISSFRSQYRRSSG